jgi:integrase
MAKQRGRGEGSIYQETATGRWRGAVVLPDGSRRRVSGRTAKECRERLRALQAEIDWGVPVGSGRLTVAVFLEEWLSRTLPARARVRSTNTIDSYTWAVRTHVVPRIGNRFLRTLLPTTWSAC